MAPPNKTRIRLNLAGDKTKKIEVDLEANEAQYDPVADTLTIKRKNADTRFQTIIGVIKGVTGFFLESEIDEVGP